MTDTNLAQAIETVQGASEYDTNVKFLLADKQILARILKYTVQEFKDMPIGDIMARACLKNAFREMYFTLCGEFIPNL